MSGRELELVRDAFTSNWIAPLGPHVDAFEREMASYIGIPHAAALSSGTAALHLALILTGVTQGDEVFCSSFTFSATANAIAYQRAIPVFIDSEVTSWNMDPALLEEELSICANSGRLPKAVVVVDLYGQCADYTRISDICSRYGVPVIEDAAEALGATCNGNRAGTFGKMAALSFNGNKIITTSGGGMLLSDDGDLIARARFLATQARDSAPHYQHSTIGYNYRLSNILAAIGRGQLAVLDQRVTQRRSNFSYYQRELGGLPGISFMPEASWGSSSRWLTCIVIEPGASGTTREDIRLALDKENIEARPLWKPMHLQPVFQGSRTRGGKVSASLFDKGLCLPSGSNLAKEDLQRVVSVIREACKYPLGASGSGTPQT
jgi:pyridoxal phosphate-dependent aminotransferase EpsN